VQTIFLSLSPSSTPRNASTLQFCTSLLVRSYVPKSFSHYFIKFSLNINHQSVTDSISNFAFSHVRLDYCNSLFHSMSIAECLMSWLQSVQNAATRLVSGARCYDHITPVLQELHWLPVRRRLDFKMATLVYLSLSGMAPAYLAVDCQLVSDEDRRQLRSATSRTCVVRRTYSNYEDRTVFCSYRSEAVEQPF